MSGFKKSSIEISVLASPVTPNINAVTIRATSDNKLQVNSLTNEESLVYESLVRNISGNLQSQLVSVSGNFASIGSLSAYTPLSTTSAISANLQGQLNLIPGSYASIGSLSAYTPLTTTFAVSSAAFNGVVTEINNRVAGDAFLQSQLVSISGNFAQIGSLSAYTPLTTTSAISANLQGQLNLIPGSYASIGSLSNYTPLSTTSDISAQLNSKIDSINLVQGSNITIVESPANTWTISGVALSGSGSSTLSGLTDVQLSSPQNGQVLSYNGTKWVNSNSTGSSGGSSTYAGLTDVSLSSPVTGQMPVYNGTQWINKYPSRNIPFTIVSSSVITSGSKDVMFVAPWNGSITDWQITCTPASTITMDVLKGSGVVPTASIISSNNPSLSASQIGFGDTSGWTTQFIKNDVFKVRVLRNTLATTITLQLNCNIIG